jgi:signal transduction histidine kinase/CheY-like chemotaxis protein/ligand-binding sensor domain-containing protein
MNRPRISFAAMVIALVALAAHGDEWTPARSFRTFGKANWRGLPQSSVAALAQDQDGVLWVGTLDGTATFDGKSITSVDAVPAAPFRGVIAAIVPRTRGGVYVASPAGVHIYDGSSWHLIPTQLAVIALAVARDGVLWMADTGGGLWTLHDEKDWQRRSEIKTSVLALAAAPDGALWAATESGAARIDNGKVEPVGGAPLPSRAGGIVVAHDGRIWVGTQGCTVHWTRGGADGWHQVNFTPWLRGGFHAMAEDRKGRIWATSYAGKVAFGNADMPWSVWDYRNAPINGGVLSVLADREGSVWFGINSVGLAQWIGEAWSHRQMIDPSDPGKDTAATFGLSRAAEGGGLLVSEFQAGVLRLDPVAWRRYGLAEGITEDVRAVVEPEPGTLFVGTRFGIFESKGGGPFKQTVKLPSGFVMGFFQSPPGWKLAAPAAAGTGSAQSAGTASARGTWYAATSTQGVLVRDGEVWRPETAINKTLDYMHVRGMTWRQNGELWIATLRGITILRDAEEPRHINNRNIPAVPESVNAVLDVSDDEVWTGGTGGIAIRRGTQWRRMKEADGIPGPTIYSLARGRDGAIWAGGSAGVGRYADGQWTVWDSRSGLLQEECNLNGLLVEDDGSVYVGTMAGLSHFDPAVTNLPAPALKLIWRNAPPHELPRGERALHLRWVAPWLGPNPVEYRQRVPRLHDAWSAASSEDHLDVENLTAGDWRVEVEARVEGTQNWSAPLTLDVAVPPFWYETLWARLAGLALIALACYAVIRLRIRALHRHAAMLEATVRERTAELRESEQRALAASRAKSAFLANMSHELRTPLNGILGFAQLLARRRNRDAEDRQGLGVIMKSGEHLLGLINDVLSLSKIEAGRITLEEKPFDIRAVAHDVEHVLRLRAEEKGLRFTCELDEASLPRAVAGDEVRIRQILLNLAGNAVKFTATGSVTIRVSWHEGRARFEVEDTGPGIAAEELPRLFEPFVQSESGMRSKEGTGLGLALSRNLARLMNGDITAESTPGRGSRFRVEVSLPETAAAALEVQRERRIAALAPGQDPPRILVVDDTLVNRAVLTQLLTAVGFQVREAASGEEALAAWRSWQPHLIWMDKRMGGLDGLEATRRIRAEEKAAGRPRIPILALSASALEHERGEILAAGCDDFVAKPFREATIFNRIAQHLGVRYTYEEDEPPHADERRVLLVDDDWICREMATEILRGRGLGVMTAASGSEALALFEANRFDLVLMDMRMPDMSGVETARRMRASAGPRLPIIAMSGDTFDGEAGRLQESGLNDYIGKPVEPAALGQVLDRWLPARHSAS